MDNQGQQEFPSSVSYTKFCSVNLGKNTLSYGEREESQVMFRIYLKP